MYYEPLFQSSPTRLVLTAVAPLGRIRRVQYVQQIQYAPHYHGETSRHRDTLRSRSAPTTHQPVYAPNFTSRFPDTSDTCSWIDENRKLTHLNNRLKWHLGTIIAFRVCTDAIITFTSIKNAFHRRSTHCLYLVTYLSQSKNAQIRTNKQANKHKHKTVQT